MPNETSPDADPWVLPGDLRQAAAWLARHGLVDAQPTTLLAACLEARRRARMVDSCLLAGIIIAAALTHAINRVVTAESGGNGTSSWVPLLVLTVLMVGMLVAQWLLDRWVRGIDRRASATLSRRAAHPIQLGWRAVLGRPYAAFAAATFAGAVVLAVSVLPIQDSILRFGAVIVLIGLAGIGVSIVTQLRHLLARPVVAEDEESLTADVIMRVEDARALAVPTMAWSLPAVLLSGDAIGWWNVASIVLVVAGCLALFVINARSAPILEVARQAMGTR